MFLKDEYLLLVHWWTEGLVWLMLNGVLVDLVLSAHTLWCMCGESLN